MTLLNFPIIIQEKEVVIMSQPIAELKDRLKQALVIRNIKPIELSEATKIPKSAISQYMSGYTKPKQDRIFLFVGFANK